MCRKGLAISYTNRGEQGGMGRGERGIERGGERERGELEAVRHGFGLQVAPRCAQKLASRLELLLVEC